MKSIVASAAAAALLVGVGFVAAEPASAAKKYTACVKKSTGEIRLLLGKPKKCKKGWKKTTWQKSAPDGDTGPAGPPGQPSTFGLVVDAKGAVIGRSLGVWATGVPMYTVQIEGGIYSYYASGLLLPSGFAVYYGDGACGGVPFAVATDTLERDQITDPALRVVERPAGPTTIGPARVYKSDGTSGSVVDLARWYRNEADVCTATTNFTGYRLPLLPVTAPPDYVGPLKLV